MLKTIVLVCAAAVPRADCSPDTALDVSLPRPFAGVMCGAGVGPVAQLAGTAIRPEPGRTYAKIICTR